MPDSRWLLISNACTDDAVAGRLFWPTQNAEGLPSDVVLVIRLCRFHRPLSMAMLTLVSRAFGLITIFIVSVYTVAAASTTRTVAVNG